MSQLNNISQKVIEKIKAGKIKMKPKALFVFQGVFLIFLAGIAMILAVFGTSFIGFALKVKGYSDFLIAIVLAVVLFVVSAWLLAKKFPAFYKRPLLLGLVIILISVAMVSLAVFLTPFHQTIMNYSQQRNVPLISPLYQCGCSHSSCSHICGASKNFNANPQSSCGCSVNSPAGRSCEAK